MNDILYEIADAILFPYQIDMLLDKAVILCHVMREYHRVMYPENLKRLFPYETEEFWILGAQLINDLAFNN